MKFDNARSDVILFEEYAANPDMQEDKDAIATLKEWKAKAEPVRDELKAKGFKKQEVIEKFKNANIFRTMLPIACSAPSRTTSSRR